MIPTSTGAAKAMSLVLPSLKGKLDLSSSKLCSFLKESISKERRGPMPVVNV